MNDDKYSGDLHAWIEPEIEARVVALILGEASDFEAEELERLMEERPEIRTFKRRLEGVHGLIGEVSVPQDDEDWQLAPERRMELLEALELAPDKEDVAVLATGKGAKEQRIRKAGRRMMWSIAACFALTLFLFVLASPIMFRGLKRSSEADHLAFDSEPGEARANVRSLYDDETDNRDYGIEVSGGAVALPQTVTGAKIENGRAVRVDVDLDGAVPKEHFAEGESLRKTAKPRSSVRMSLQRLGESLGEAETDSERPPQDLAADYIADPSGANRGSDPQDQSGLGMVAGRSPGGKRGESPVVEHKKALPKTPATPAPAAEPAPATRPAAIEKRRENIVRGYARPSDGKGEKDAAEKPDSGRRRVTRIDQLKEAVVPKEAAPEFAAADPGDEDKKKGATPYFENPPALGRAFVTPPANSAPPAPSAKPASGPAPASAELERFAKRKAQEEQKFGDDGFGGGGAGGGGAAPESAIAQNSVGYRMKKGEGRNEAGQVNDDVYSGALLGAVTGTVAPDAVKAEQAGGADGVVDFDGNGVPRADGERVQDQRWGMKIAEQAKDVGQGVPETVSRYTANKERGGEKRNLDAGAVTAADAGATKLYSELQQGQAKVDSKSEAAASTREKFKSLDVAGGLATPSDQWDENGELARQDGPGRSGAAQDLPELADNASYFSLNVPQPAAEGLELEERLEGSMEKVRTPAAIVLSDGESAEHEKVDKLSVIPSQLAPAEPGFEWKSKAGETGKGARVARTAQRMGVKNGKSREFGLEEADPFARTAQQSEGQLEGDPATRFGRAEMSLGGAVIQGKDQPAQDGAQQAARGESEGELATGFFDVNGATHELFYPTEYDPPEVAGKKSVMSRDQRNKFKTAETHYNRPGDDQTRSKFLSQVDKAWELAVPPAGDPASVVTDELFVGGGTAGTGVVDGRVSGENKPSGTAVSGAGGYGGASRIQGAGGYETVPLSDGFNIVGMEKSLDRDAAPGDPYAVPSKPDAWYGVHKEEEETSKRGKELLSKLSSTLDSSERTVEELQSKHWAYTDRGNEELNRKLEEIIIPEVNFDDTTVTEALKYLQDQAQMLDAGEVDESKRGVTFSVTRPRLQPRFQAPVAGIDAELDAEDGLGAADPGLARVKDLKLRNVPLGTALQYLADQSKMRYRVEGGSVAMVPLASGEADDVQSRAWTLPQAVWRKIESGPSGVHIDSFGKEAGKDGQVALNPTDALKGFGIDFPPGAAVNFIPESGVLIVSNTSTNLELVDKLVEDTTKQLANESEALKRMEKSAAEEPFSTFSLHVSDVSFKLAKASLDQGVWPKAESIRVEEFVNTFDYGDPAPTQADKVACKLEQAAHPFMQQRNMLRVSMRTAALGRSASTPLRLTVLLDNSGSMDRADRVESVKNAFKLLAAQLNPQDRVTLIGFARAPRLLADRVKGDQARQLAQFVESTPSEGGTNLEEALRLGVTKAKEQFLEGGQNRIILLTDGAANLGNAKPGDLGSMVEKMRQQGIAFDACGVGADGLNDDILESLTRKGDGRYYFLDNPEDADEGFAKQIAGALRPAAKNVKVQVEFNPKRVDRYKLYGFEKHRLKKEDFRNDSVDAAEMAAEEAGNAIYQYQVLPEGDGEIGTVSVRFLDMASGQMVEKKWTIPYDAGTPRLGEATPSMRLAAGAALVGEKLKGSIIGEGVEMDRLTKIMSDLPGCYPADERVKQLLEMTTKVRELTAE